MQTHLFIDSTASVPAIRIVGDLDFAVKDAFAGVLGSLSHRTSAIAIDFSKCVYFDASTLGALAVFARTRAGQTLNLVAPGRHAKRILHLVGFDHLFRIVDELGECDDDFSFSRTA